MSSASKVTIYTTLVCPFCIRAKQMLDNKGVAYEEIRVDVHPHLRREMMEKSGLHTVPQIWVGATHVGGFDALWALERRGHLDPLLNA